MVAYSLSLLVQCIHRKLGEENLEVRDVRDHLLRTVFDQCDHIAALEYFKDHLALRFRLERYQIWKIFTYHVNGSSYEIISAADVHRLTNQHRIEMYVDIFIRVPAPPVVSADPPVVSAADLMPDLMPDVSPASVIPHYGTQGLIVGNIPSSDVWRQNSCTFDAVLGLLPSVLGLLPVGHTGPHADSTFAYLRSIIAPPTPSPQ